MKDRGFLMLLLPVLFASLSAAGQYESGLRGKVLSDDGSVLAYASIYVKQTGGGSATDASGNYEVRLAPGTYDVYFQYLGYQTQHLTIELGNEFLTKNITLKTQNVQLQAVTVRARKEDPAYSVMRRAIARAKYHLQQVDSFSAKVYIKGKGKLNDYPWLAKKALEKEGITKDRMFIQESVSEIQYKRPSIFSEKVIAIYTQGKNDNPSPNEYIFGSLYEPEIAETISPLSPKSFSYYRFEYLGIFKDQGFAVNKIKVIPRSPGDNVFEGTINIVEDVWSIHSVELNSLKLGVKFKARQIYHPVSDVTGKSQAWMPVSQTYLINGSVFGFDFEGQYLATVKDYKIFLNPALRHEINVVDEKAQAVPVTKPSVNRTKRTEQIKKDLEQGKEVTAKDLNMVLREYEKEDVKQERISSDVLSNRSFKIDSLARKKDSTFWVLLRPAPLEPEEVRGYVKADSIAEVNRKRDEGDSLKESKSKGFQIYDVLLGDRYRLGKFSSLEIKTPYSNFNTVEGPNLVYRLSFLNRWVVRDSLKPDERPKVTRLEFMPVLRYAFKTEKFSGYLRTDFRTRLSRVTLETGRYIQQYNNENPINPAVNSFATLFLGQNYMKILERDFADLSYRQRLSDRFSFSLQASWNRRREIFNTTDYSLFGTGEKKFTLNTPVSIELPITTFPDHEALILSAGIEIRPWQKFRIRNGVRYRAGGSPVVNIDYRKGVQGTLGSDVDYDLLQAGIRHGFKVGIRGKLDYRIAAGKFLNSSTMYFPDFKHFNGNRVFVTFTEPLTGFRLLDYYKFSTADRFITAVGHYHFRKFLVTRIPKLRLLGIQENIFAGYLSTPAAGNYLEAGYGLDGIFRVFRVEVAGSYLNGNAQGLGFRLGISSTIGAGFND